MGQVMIVRRGGAALVGPSIYTYSGASHFFDEGNGNWNLQFTTSGKLVTKIDTTVQVFLVGGGGAGNRKGGSGGGGFCTTATGITLFKDIEYSIDIGNGGASTGEDGGDTTAFSNVAEGGNGGVAGTVTGRTCTVISTSGSAGNVYSYASLSASAVSIGSGERTVNLAYPYVNAYHTNGTYLYKGVSGYYRCEIVSEGAFVGTAGSNGTGGSASYAFGGSSGMQYGGAGSAPSSVSGAANTGKGGGGSNNLNGTAFGQGGSGIAIIRNVR